MPGLHIEKEAVVEIKNRRYTCVGRGPGGSYLFAPHQGRGNLYLKPESLFDQIQNNHLKILEDVEYHGEPLPDSHFDLTALETKEREKVMMRHFYMQRLIDYRDKGGKLSDFALNDFARRTHQAYVAQCKMKEQEAPIKPMSAAALRRWFRAWRKSGFNTKSLVHDARGNSHSKLSRRQLELLEAAIEEDYLDKRRMTAKHVHTLLKAKINIENRARKMDGRQAIATPHYNTLLTHIKRVDLFDQLKARYNAQYALKVTRQYSITPPVNRHLERMQADHTQLDVYVDFGGNILARPWLTLLLDSYSKAVLGYWLTPEPPSAESVMQALCTAVMPKDLVAMGGDPAWQWPMHGIPSELTLDNGKEFHGRDLEMAAAELGITLTFTPPRKPYFKAQVERKFGEINRSLLAKLTGQVFKYEPEKHGIDYPHLNFEDLKKIFLQWVTTVLHRTPNKDGNTPEELWLDSVQKYGVPGAGLSSDYIEMCLSKSGQERVVHPNGIHFNSLVFNNEWLSRLRNKLTAKNKADKPTAKFKWSASDVGLIWVLDPNTHEYFPVHSKEEYAHGRSLYNHRVVLREKRQRSKEKLSDDKYLDAVLAVDQAVNEIVENKKTKNKRLGSKVLRYLKGRPKAPHIDKSNPPKTLDSNRTIQEVNTHPEDIPINKNLSTDSISTITKSTYSKPQEDDLEVFPDDLEI
ncbi:hypothetical protein [Microbulbifer sp. JMSA003]|uniref:hypothetical protein n=1 Tax=Microbulbifer sp. JMSA003 TaxID=3243369 RepID=UPI00403A0933